MFRVKNICLAAKILLAITLAWLVLAALYTFEEYRADSSVANERMARRVSAIVRKIIPIEAFLEHQRDLSADNSNCDEFTRFNVDQHVDVYYREWGVNEGDYVIIYWGDQSDENWSVACRSGSYRNNSVVSIDSRDLSEEYKRGDIALETEDVKPIIRINDEHVISVLAKLKKRMRDAPIEHGTAPTP